MECPRVTLASFFLPPPHGEPRADEARGAEEDGVSATRDHGSASGDFSDIIGYAFRGNETEDET